MVDGKANLEIGKPVRLFLSQTPFSLAALTQSCLYLQNLETLLLTLFTRLLTDCLSLETSWNQINNLFHKIQAIRVTYCPPEKCSSQQHRIFIREHSRSIDNSTCILQMCLQMTYCLVFLTPNTYVYTDMHTCTYFKHLYVTQKREENLGVYDLAVEGRRISWPNGAWWFGEWSFLRLTPEPNISVTDLRRSLGSSQTSHCDRSARPGLSLQHLRWGLTSRPLPSPPSQGKPSFRNLEAPGKHFDGFPSRDHRQRALPRARSKPRDHFSRALSLRR